MTDSEHTLDEPLDNTLKNIEENDSSKPDNSNLVSKILRFLVKIFIIVLTLATIGYGGYWVWGQYKISIRDNAQAVAQLNNQVQQLAVGVQSLQNDNISLQRKLIEFKQSVADQQQIWQQAVIQRQDILESRLNDALSNNDYEWLFNEVNYWLQLAQQRINQDGNHSAVIRLLQSAKQQLEVLNWKEVNIIVVAIDKDIERLSDDASYDLLKLFQELHQVQQSIARRPLSPHTIATSDTAQQPTNHHQPWYHPTVLWYKTRALLGQFISVSNASTADKALLSKQQQLILKQRLQLQLEQAKFALLQGNHDLFKQAIDICIETLEPFNARDQQQWLTQLAESVSNYATLEHNTLHSLATFQQQIKLLKINLNR